MGRWSSPASHFVLLKESSSSLSIRPSANRRSLHCATSDFLPHHKASVNYSLGAEDLSLSSVLSHISQKTSEMWGTQHFFATTGFRELALCYATEVPCRNHAGSS